MIPEILDAPCCALCSLLCELPTEATPSPDADFGATFCSRRNRELDSMRLWEERSESLASLSAWEIAMQQAKSLLKGAGEVLVTGRMRCVETSRGALRLAERCHAMIDAWDSDAQFEGIAGFQRVGGATVSLSEARDLAQLLMIVGDDSLIEDYPRLPAALSRSAPTPVLLLGPWSHRGCKPWLDAGFEVLAIDTPLETLPRSLALASECETIPGWESQASRWLHQEGYTALLWSMTHLNIPHGDVWYESMMEWIATRNERFRAAAICWGGLDSTFQEVCTWWTGFPGRVSFDAGETRYDPRRFSASRWLEDRRSARRGSAAPSIVVWIDDAFEELPAAIDPSHHPCIVVSSRPPPTHSEAIWLPSQRAGFGRDADFFRGDHAILVRTQDPHLFARQLPSVAEWLKGLLEP